MGSVQAQWGRVESSRGAQTAAMAKSERLMELSASSQRCTRCGAFDGVECVHEALGVELTHRGLELPAAIVRLEHVGFEELPLGLVELLRGQVNNLVGEAREALPRLVEVQLERQDVYVTTRQMGEGGAQQARERVSPRAGCS